MINLSSNSWLKTGSRLATRDDDGCERNTDAGMPRGPRGHLEAINVIATVLPNVLLLFQSYFAAHWTFYFPQKPILATFWIRGIKFKKCVFSFQVRFWLLRLLELDWTDWTFICAICVIYTCKSDCWQCQFRRVSVRFYWFRKLWCSLRSDKDRGQSMISCCVPASIVDRLARAQTLLAVVVCQRQNPFSPPAPGRNRSPV